MTSIEDMVGKLLRVPFVYPAYTESDPLGTPSIRLDKDDQVVLISYAVRSNESLWMPTWQPTKNRTQYLTLKVLTGKGYIALMTVSKAALIDFLEGFGMNLLKVGVMYRVPWRTWVCLTSGHDTNLEEGKLAFVLSQVPHEYMKQVIRVRVLCPSGDIGDMSLPCSGLSYWKELSIFDAGQTAS